MAKIVITGGTGLVGKALEKILNERNHEVCILTRNPKQKNHYKWDLATNFIAPEALENADYIIHLAGAGIADKKWTDVRKKELISSRVDTVNLLFKKIQEQKTNLKGFISSSGISYYGAITTENIFEEDDKAGHDFISKICVEWENAAHQFSALEIPITILRTGVVLSNNGGALKKMNTPLFLSALGTGKQYIPWIHIDDLCMMYVQAVEDNNFSGIFNAAAPEHHTNASFTKTLGKVLRKFVTPFNVPKFILKLAVGELAVIVLEGSRVSTKKIETRFSFKFPSLKDALADIYK